MPCVFPLLLNEMSGGGCFCLAFCKDYSRALVNKQHKSAKNMFIQKSTLMPPPQK
jgi:hypothetical protein